MLINWINSYATYLKWYIYLYKKQKQVKHVPFTCLIVEKIPRVDSFSEETGSLNLRKDLLSKRDELRVLALENLEFSRQTIAISGIVSVSLALPASSGENVVNAMYTMWNAPRYWAKTGTRSGYSGSLRHQDGRERVGRNIVRMRRDYIAELDE